MNRLQFHRHITYVPRPRRRVDPRLVLGIVLIAGAVVTAVGLIYAAS